MVRCKIGCKGRNLKGNNSAQPIYKQDPAILTLLHTLLHRTSHADPVRSDLQ